MSEIAVVQTGVPADGRVRTRVGLLAARLGAGVNLAVVWTYDGEALFEPATERERVRRLMASSLAAWRSETPTVAARVSLEVGRLSPVVRRLAATSELVAVSWDAVAVPTGPELADECGGRCSVLLV
jgi:hypothetical protein